MPLIARNLSKTYKDDVESQTVFSGVSIDLDSGESLLVVGLKGAGKSTLINILGCLEAPTDGSYLIGETDPLTFNRHKIARFRRDYLGFLFSEPYLAPQLTVLENVLVPCLATGLPLKSDVSFAKELLEQMKISDCQDSYPQTLSADQRQRSAAVRAMVKRPTLILADEPVALLDSRLAEACIDNFLAAQKMAGSMLVLTSDCMEFKEKFDRVAKLEKKRWTISGRQKYGVEVDDAPPVFGFSSDSAAPSLGFEQTDDEVIIEPENVQTPQKSNREEERQVVKENELESFRRRFQ